MYGLSQIGIYVQDEVLCVGWNILQKYFSPTVYEVLSMTKKDVLI